MLEGQGTFLKDLRSRPRPEREVGISQEERGREDGKSFLGREQKVQRWKLAWPTAGSNFCVFYSRALSRAGVGERRERGVGAKLNRVSSARSLVEELHGRRQV